MSNNAQQSSQNIEKKFNPTAPVGEKISTSNNQHETTPELDSESTKLAASWCSNIIKIFSWSDTQPPDIADLMFALDDNEQMQTLNNVIDDLLCSKATNIASTNEALSLLNELTQSTKALQTKYQSTLIDSQKQLKQHKAYIDCEEI